MAENQQTLKYSFEGDASKFVAEAKKAKAAAEDVSKASSGASNNSASGSGPGSKQATANINAQTKAWEQHAQKVSDVAAKYRMLEQSRARFEKNPQAIGEINKQQVQLLKTMERAAQNEQEYGKFLQARLQLQQKMGSSASGGSNRQSGQFQGLGLAVGAIALGGLGAAGRQLYQNSIGSYQDLNNQYMFDRNLTGSQNNLANSQYNLGKQLSGYQQFKNNIGAAIYGSPAAAPVAIGGDILGMLAGPAGGALNLAAAYKIFKGGSAAAAAARGATTSAGVAAGAADIFGTAGGAAKAGTSLTKTAEVINTGTGLVEATTVAKMGEALPAVGKFASALKFLGKAVPIVSGIIEAVDATVTTIAAAGYHDQVLKAVDSGKLTKDEAQKLGQANSAHQAQGFPFGSEIFGIGGLSKEEEDALQKKAGIGPYAGSSGSVGPSSTNSKLADVKNSPVFQLQLKQLQNQFKDFQVDQARQTFETQRNYARQQEDIGRNRQYANQDYAVQQQKFGIQRGRINFDYARSTGRAGEDYTRAATRNEEDFTRNTGRTLDDYARQVQRIEIGVFRTRRDYAIQTTRLQEDYTRQSKRLLEDYNRQVNRSQQDFNRTVSRAQQDYTKTLVRAFEDYTRTVGRAQEDYNRTISRSQQDFSRTTIRAIQDYGITAGRATEDANRERLRSDQDYARSRLELERNTARSTADINRGLKEGLISIVAPGLASSQGYQIAKLFRDTARQKQRLGEDTQFASQGLDLNYARQQQDILRSESRTLADAMRSLTRTFEDANLTLARSIEDATISLTRTLQDAAISYDRTLQDAAISLDRTLQDASISFSRAIEDASLSFSRGMQDLNLEQARASFDALKQANDSLLDASLSLRDANITEARALEDIAREHSRAMQDIDLQYSRSMADIQTEYTRAVQDLVLAENDAAKEHTRTLADLALSERRGKEDFDFTMEGIKIAGDRFTRDFGLSIQQMTQQFAQSLQTDIYATAQLFDGLQRMIDAANGITPGQNGQPFYPTPDGKPIPGYAGGLNYVPSNDFPARLHPGEMVVTRGESEQLRQAGYRPESRNLGSALRTLFLKGTPGFAGGWDGTSVLQPQQYLADFSRNLAGEQYLQQVWNPGVSTVTRDPYYGTYSSSYSPPANPLTPYGQQQMDSGQYRTPGDAYHPTTSYFSGLPDHSGWNGTGTPTSYAGYNPALVALGSNNPEYSPTGYGVSVSQALRGSYDYSNDPHGNYDYSDPSLRNPTWANSQTPGFGPTSPGWYGFGGFSSRDAFYAANPEWVSGTGSKWQAAHNSRVQSAVAGDGVISAFITGYNNTIKWGNGNPATLSMLKSQVADYLAGENISFSDLQGYLAGPGPSAAGSGSPTNGGGGNISTTAISNGRAGSSRALPAPSASRSIPQVAVSSGTGKNGQPQLIVQPSFVLSSQDQVSIVMSELDNFKTNVDIRFAQLANSQANRTGRY